VLPVVAAAAVVILLAGSLAARYVASERTAAGIQPAAAATVPGPVAIEIHDLEVPAWGSMKESRDWAVTFQTDLDLLAPMGDGPDNAADYFMEFTKEIGPRLAEVEEAMAGRLEAPGLGPVYPADHALLLEAEPWVDQATMAFYPDLLELQGYVTRVPNLLHMLTLAKSWVARGLESEDAAAAMEDFRRAIRLGRLLRQEDVTIIADLVGLACIRFGADGIYRRAVAEGDLETALIASVVLGEVAPQRLMTSERITAGNLSPFGRIGPDGELQFNISDRRIDRLMAMITDGPDRRFGGEAFIGLSIIRNLGTDDQQARVVDFLTELRDSPSPFIAHMAEWALEAPLSDGLIEDAFPGE
jgi:hypothetical protein